ncbi:hypothetical protein [Paraburkholderia bryophila]|uniref:Uncharacterized protein n=1 Tax=Paraburkholderia bryophila TaxID=420952 RepID=A0A329CD16_9BURK|nr:hypothetical protein [Paraburkholderia bryophila]RAS32060.1 hypothetical protein BX591_108168 [Paraburkholderia bryophila]
MENIPGSAKHVACDFFLDVQLLCIVRDEAVFDFGEEIRVFKLDNSEAQVGQFGRLALFHTRHGERWQFRPYRSGSWRRVPELDTPSSWVWRCIKTGDLITTAIGVVPNHTPTAHLPPEDENDGFPF